MAVVQTVCNSYKLEILSGVHTNTDTYKIALFNSASASLDKTTTAYTTTGEVSGTGYSAGGQALTGFASALSGDTSYLDFNDPQWATATITADCALIYNSSKSNKAVCVLNFGTTSSTNDTWKLTLPAPGASATVTIA